MESNEVKIVKKSPLKLGATILVLGLCWSLVYVIPFAQYTWYDPLREYLGGSNFQMSLLLTIYGFGNVFLAPIGGWISDRFNYKWMYVGSVALNGVLSLIFALVPGYGIAVILWIGFAVSSLLMNYPTHIKIVRDLATDENQGKIFGINETCIGVGNILLTALMNIGFIKFGEGVAGIKGIGFVDAILAVILTILIAILLDDPKKTGMINVNKTAADEKANFGRDFVKVAKHPETWFYALTIFSVYAYMSSMSYFTAYFTQVLGLTVVFSAWMAIIRQFGMQLVGSPIGGFIADKIKSPSKVILLSYIIGLIAYGLLLFKKTGWSLSGILFLVMFMSTFVYMSRGCYYSTLREVGVPRSVSATTAGIGAMIGFSPDIFQFAMFGWWLDTHTPEEAYRMIFIYQIIVLCIGIFAAFMIMHYAKKHGTVRGGTYDHPMV